MKRGRRLYECGDCKTRTAFHWTEINRASKARCPACGCTILELVTTDAKNELAEQQRQRVLGSHGSLDLASNADKPHRKVT